MPLIRRSEIEPVSGSSYPAPHDEGLGEYRAWKLSDAGALTQFGALVEELAPGARSSLRHWHENEDEFVYLLSGEVVLVDDEGDHAMRPGDSAAFPAGDRNGHHLQNRSDRPATYLVVGTRAERDRCHYPDHDLVYWREGDRKGYAKRDGTPIG
jgi:uncharacterized cupin superfamily protein